MWCDLVVLIASLALLVYAADMFVDGAAAIAQNLGVSALLIGLTVVGFGTSIPEVLVSGVASWQGSTGLAVGNALGSNIANIGLILGCCAFIVPLTFRPKLLSRELPLLSITSLLCFGLALDGLTRMDGIILLVGLIGFIACLVRDGIEQTRNGDSRYASATRLPMRSSVTWLLTIFGLLGVLIGSRLLVWASVNIADALGVSDLVIGLTLVAIGTSLPELAASAASVLKGKGDMAVGNVIGSNMYNLLAVYSLPGLIAPGPVNEHVIYRDFPVMLVFTLALFVFGFGFRKAGKINRCEGLLLLSGYGAYQWLILESTIAS